MPLSPEKIAALDGYFAPAQPALSPEKMAALDAHFNPQPSYGERVASDHTARMEGVKSTLVDSLTGKQGNFQTAIQLAGAGMGAIGDYGAEGAKSLYNTAVPDMVKKPISSIAESLGSALSSGAQSTANVIDSVAPSIGDMLMNHPQELKTLKAAGDIYGTGTALAGVASGAKNLASGLMKSDNLNPLKMLNDKTSGNPALMTPKPTFTPENYHQGVGKTVSDAQASRAPFYDYMKESAQGQTIPSSPLVKHAKGIISDNADNPFNTDTVVRLKKFVAQYEGNNSISVADAVELKQDINSIYKPNALDQGKNSAYFKFGNQLDSGIQDAANKNSVFKKAKELADLNHVDNVATAVKNNDLLKPIWQPEDANAYKSVEAGRATYVPDETRLRARQMVGNIKTQEQLDAVTRLLPPDMAQAFREEVGKNIKSGSVMFRAKELGNALGEPLRSPKHIFNAITGQSYSPEEKLLLKAVKQPSPQLTSKQLGEELAKLKAIAPSRQLALPYYPEGAK